MPRMTIDSRISIKFATKSSPLIVITQPGIQLNYISNDLESWGRGVTVINVLIICLNTRYNIVVRSATKCFTNTKNSLFALLGICVYLVLNFSEVSGKCIRGYTCQVILMLEGKDHTLIVTCFFKSPQSIRFFIHVQCTWLCLCCANMLWLSTTSLMNWSYCFRLRLKLLLLQLMGIQMLPLRFWWVSRFV